MKLGAVRAPARGVACTCAGLFKQRLEIVAPTAWDPWMRRLADRKNSRIRDLAGAIDELDLDRDRDVVAEAAFRWKNDIPDKAAVPCERIYRKCGGDV
jgi:hypothetical protein